MKGCVIFFLDFRYNFPIIFNIIPKSFATYECCHSCFLLFKMICVTEKHNFESRQLFNHCQKVLLEAQLLYNQIDVTEYNNVPFSFFDHIYIVCGSMWTFLRFSHLEFVKNIYISTFLKDTSLVYYYINFQNADLYDNQAKYFNFLNKIMFL